MHRGDAKGWLQTDDYECGQLSAPTHDLLGAARRRNRTRAMMCDICIGYRGLRSTFETSPTRAVFFLFCLDLQIQLETPKMVL
jgi:hypothetical protein